MQEVERGVPQERLSGRVVHEFNSVMTVKEARELAETLADHAEVQEKLRLCCNQHSLGELGQPLVDIVTSAVTRLKAENLRLREELRLSQNAYRGKSRVNADMEIQLNSLQAVTIALRDELSEARECVSRLQSNQKASAEALANSWTEVAELKKQLDGMRAGKVEQKVGEA